MADLERIADETGKAMPLSIGSPIPADDPALPLRQLARRLERNWACELVGDGNDTARQPMPEWLLPPMTPSADLVEWPLPANPASARQAREFTAAQLSEWGLPAPLIGDCALVVSELVTNALDQVIPAEGATEPTGLADQKANEQSWCVLLQLLRTPDGLYVIVWDRSGGTPTPRPLDEVDEVDERGRGLLIVTALTDISLIYRNPLGGKAVIAGWRVRARPPLHPSDVGPDLPN